MQGYIEITNLVIQARIAEREAEAAGDRLAAAARSRGGTNGSVRRSVGLFLIRAGQRVGGGQGSAGSSATRPAPRMAA